MAIEVPITPEDAERFRPILELMDTPGWAMLKDIYTESLERSRADLAEAMLPARPMNKVEKGVGVGLVSPVIPAVPPQAQLAYVTGYFEGMRDVLLHPERVAAKIERNLERALREEATRGEDDE